MANFKGDAQAIKVLVNPFSGALNEAGESAIGGDSHQALRENLLEKNAREKREEFDYGRMPECRASTSAAARGTFTLYESQSEFTKAGFLQNTATPTPVFVRFSTLTSMRSSGDCIRDPREFAVRFLTEEGNFDLVGSNIPVLYRQHDSKSADFSYTAKPESDDQALPVSSTNNNFWDFIAQHPESMHAALWAMSDHALPRSFAMMEGFGVHTFRFVNSRGKSHLAKFHWKPLLGTHTLVWDEAVKLAAKDVDFHRRHLWELIDQGNFPEWELGVQIVAEDDRYKFDFDLHDPTKIIPESIVPIRVIGKLTLNQNPQNYFSEIEQVVFHTDNLITGIEFSDDPTKVFSDSDVQMSRLCSTHFNESPIDRSRAMLDKCKRDGQLHSLSEPVRLLESARGERIAATNQSFNYHYSQAALFWRSQSPWEQKHIIAAFCFELAKVSSAEIRERVVTNLLEVDGALARRVASVLGIALPTATAAVETAENLAIEPSLSLVQSGNSGIVGRCVAVLVADGFEGERLIALREALIAGGATLKIIGSRLGEIKCSLGNPLYVDYSLATVGSVMFDAVYIPGGARSVEALCKDAHAILFVKEAYKHGKCVAATNEGGMLITRAARSSVMSDVFKGPGVFTCGPSASTQEFVQSFLAAAAAHRFSERPDMDAIVA